MAQNITLGANSMEITDPAGEAIGTYIPKTQIVSVGGVFIENPIKSIARGFKYNTITTIVLHLADSRRYEIEAQDVANQGTWNLGTRAALNTAVTAINTWLP